MTLFTSSIILVEVDRSVKYQSKLCLIKGEKAMKAGEGGHRDEPYWLFMVYLPLMLAGGEEERSEGWI